jgi:hypothetical protein
MVGRIVGSDFFHGAIPFCQRLGGLNMAENFPAIVREFPQLGVDRVQSGLPTSEQRFEQRFDFVFRQSVLTSEKCDRFQKFGSGDSGPCNQSAMPSHRPDRVKPASGIQWPGYRLFNRLQATVPVPGYRVRWLEGVSEKSLTPPSQWEIGHCRPPPKGQARFTSAPCRCQSPASAVSKLVRL